MSKASVLDVVTHRDFGWVRYACITKYAKDSQIEALKRLGLVFEEGHAARRRRHAS